MVYRWKRYLCSGNMDNFKFNISCLCCDSYKLNFNSIRIEATKNLGSILKSRDITLPTKVHLVKAIFIQCSALSSVTQSRPTLCNPMDCSTPGFPVLHQLPEPTQTHVHSVSQAIQPTHSLSSPSPPVVIYRCESWTIKKAEHKRIDAFELWCWRRLLRVPWTRRSNQSILKEINPEYSLEGLMLKLKLQYFGHLMPRANELKRP